MRGARVLVQSYKISPAIDTRGFTVEGAFRWSYAVEMLQNRHHGLVLAFDLPYGELSALVSGIRQLHNIDPVAAHTPILHVVSSNLSHVERREVVRSALLCDVVLLRWDVCVGCDICVA